MGKVEELEAHLEVAKLEEKLVAAKTKKGGAPHELKEELREARKAHRLMREGALDGDNG